MTGAFLFMVSLLSWAFSRSLRLDGMLLLGGLGYLLMSDVL